MTRTHQWRVRIKGSLKGFSLTKSHQDCEPKRRGSAHRMDNPANISDSKPMTRSRHAGVVLTPHEIALRLARSLPGVPAGAILDPACGEGALLLAALEARGGDPEFAKTGLFGLEIDRNRALLARKRLTDASGLPAGSLDGQILVADALDPTLEWPRGTSILANPPWLSFSGRQTGSLEMEAARSFAQVEGSGWPSLHGAFLARIAEHVAAERTSAAVLLPAPVAFLPSYAPLRSAIETQVELTAPPIELGEDVFPGITEPTILVTLAAPSGEAKRVSGRPWLAEDPADREFLARLAKFPRLAPGTFADPGVHTGNAASELIFDSAAANRTPVRRGRDLFAYDLREATTYLRTDLEPTPELRFRVGPLERYAEFPILLRQTANRPIAALHSPAAHFRNSLLGMRRVDGLDPAFCVAVLNSTIATEFHRAANRDSRQRNFPQVKVGHLTGLPFPIAKRAEAPELHDKIAGLVHALEPDDPVFEEQAACIDDLVTKMFGLTSRRTSPSSPSS